MGQRSWLCAALVVFTATASAAGLQPGEYRYHIRVSSALGGGSISKNDDVNRVCLRAKDVADGGWSFVESKIDPVGQCHLLGHKTVVAGSVKWKMDCGGGYVGDSHATFAADHFKSVSDFTAPVGSATFTARKEVVGRRIGACHS